MGELKELVYTLISGFISHTPPSFIPPSEPFEGLGDVASRLVTGLGLILEGHWDLVTRLVMGLAGVSIWVIGIINLLYEVI